MMRHILLTAITLALMSLSVLAPSANASINNSWNADEVFSEDMEGIIPMSDAELADARGGFGGILFSLTGYGDISQLSGGLPEGVSITSQSPDLVSLNIGLGTLPNTGGFVQFASIVGNNNIINHTLNLNVYILDGGVADTSGIANGTALGF